MSFHSFMICDNAPELDSTGFENVWSRPKVSRFSAGGPSNVQIDQADIVTSIITVLFGVLHCFAWHSHFPSEAERLLWRIASLITTVSPIFWVALFTADLMNGVNEDVFSPLLLILHSLVFLST